jgi:hypothetical protein
MGVNNWLVTDECRCKQCRKDDEYECRELGFAVRLQDRRAGSDIRASQEYDQVASLVMARAAATWPGSPPALCETTVPPEVLEACR